MTEKTEPKRYTPDKLLANFTKSRFWTCVAIALGVHVVLMLITSVTYIRVEWFGAEPSAKEETVVAEKTPAAPAPDIEPETPVGTESETPAATGDVYELMGGAEGAEALRQAKDTPAVKEITEVAKPEDIPAVPDELGISIEDTNPR